MDSEPLGDRPPAPDLGELAALGERMGRERWRVVSDVAQVVACYLRCHPRVEAVRYPGLKQDPLFGEAARTLVGGFGPVVWYCSGGMWVRLTCDGLDARAACLALDRQIG